jgi:ketosteroid isomerase-like protein
MRSRLVIFAVVLVAFAVNTAAQNAPAAPSKNPGSAAAAAQMDKAYLQSIWDGWASNDVEKQGRFYMQGPGHLFFDVAPLKYDSWDAYKAGVAPSLQNSPKVTFTLNDDIQIHPEGKIAWVDGTLNMEGASPQGEKQTLTLRWTAILERQQDGRWLIQHEHVSVPAEAPQQ